jgi:hypothetical protein
LAAWFGLGSLSHRCVFAQQGELDWTARKNRAAAAQAAAPPATAGGSVNIYSHMTDVQPHNQTPGNPFEFGLTLVICVAVSSAIAVAIAGIGWLVLR